jgi:hypothetical protein
LATESTCAGTCSPNGPVTRTARGAPPRNRTSTSTTSSRLMPSGLKTTSDAPSPLVSRTLATSPTPSESTSAKVLPAIVSSFHEKT